MAGLKEIRRRISSVTSTKQITRAMKLVSAAKLRRAQLAAEKGRAYNQKLLTVFQRLQADLKGEFSHPLLESPDEISTRRVVFVSGDRGLCGAFNTNVLKRIQAEEFNDSTKPEFVSIGKRSVSSVHRMRWNSAAEYEALPENANNWPIEEMVSSIIDDFKAGKCQEVVMYYTFFKSALSQHVVREVLLPLNRVGLSDEQDTTAAVVEDNRPVKYSPDPRAILDQLIPILVRTRLRQAGLESKASEHGARMTAMDAATNNANDLTDKLRLFYNRARQSTITTELIDIVGGAEAIK